MDPSLEKNISIVIPIYNESNNIDPLIQKIISAVKDVKYEIIIVNDGSNDETENLLFNYKNIPFIKIINHEFNLGQSKAFQTGISNAKFDTIVTLDGDGQNNPFDISKLLNEYFADQSIYLVGGIRFNRKDNFIKIASSRIANRIRIFFLSDDCPDTGCSLKVFDRNIFLLFPFFDGIHRFLPALFKGYGKKTKFINVDHLPREYGYSKYGTFGRLFRGIKDLIKVAKIIKEFKNNRA